MNLSEAYTFGNQPLYEIERLIYSSGTIIQPEEKLLLERPEISRERFFKALEDINKTWGETSGVITDPETGRLFEGAMANTDASLENGVDIEMSTFTSSVSGNIGNAAELAEHAALHPDRRRLYLASFGNGLSSYWSKEESDYIRKHGRYIQEDGEALPTVASLARAIRAAGFIMTRCFSTNSAGGGYATALMGALPEGQVTHAYLKSRTNISNHRAALLWGLGILAGDMVDDIIYKRVSADPWRLTPELLTSVKEKLPNIYSEEAHNRHSTVLQKAGSSHKLTKMYNDLIAFSRGGEKYGHPAAQDTIRALRQQPEMLLTYHFPLQDRLYSNLEDLRNFLRLIHLGSLALANGQVEALIPPGKHRDHTQYPGLRWAGEKYAFNRKLG